MQFTGFHQRTCRFTKAVQTDNFAPATDLERIFLGQINRADGSTGAVNKIGVTGTRLQGDAGFIQY